MLPKPTHSFTVKDANRNTTYKVWGYREITAAEALTFARLSNGRKRPPRNKVIEILTQLGLHGS